MRRYLADWIAANGNPPFDHPTLQAGDPTPFFTGPATGPTPEENGWKDTVFTPADYVTRIRIRWAIQLPRPGDSAGRRQHLPDQPAVRHRLHLALPPRGARGQRDDAADDGHPDLGGRRQLSGRLPRLAGRPARSGRLQRRRLLGARRPHLGGGPDAEHAARTCGNASTTRTATGRCRSIYAVGDRVFFGGHVYRALQAHQATAANSPPNAGVLAAGVVAEAVGIA